MFFRTKKPKIERHVTSEMMASHQWKPAQVVKHIEEIVCSSSWNPNDSISRITGMALGGLRSSALFSNARLNEQANALSSLIQKTLPLVVHVSDSRSGNNQTLRLPFFRFFAGNVQQSVDFTLIAHRLSELSLLPVMVIHSGKIHACEIPDPDQMRHYLGAVEDSVQTPTPAQQSLFGKQRRRLPEFWNPDQPMTTGLTYPPLLRDRQWAARQTFFADHLPELLQQALDEYESLTGRTYEPAIFRQPNASHQVVVIEETPAVTDLGLPLTQILFMTPELHKKLLSCKLTFVDCNHSRALGSALGLSGYSLIHYGEVDNQTIRAGLELNDERQVGIVGAPYLYPEPLTPREEIYNQQLSDLYPNLPHNPGVSGSFAVITAPLAMQNHPEGDLPLADLHRFWAQNGKYLASQLPEYTVATPVLATSVLPAGSGKMQLPTTEIHAERVVSPLAFLETMVACMNRENYEMQEVEQNLRKLAGAFKKALSENQDADQTYVQILSALVVQDDSAFAHQWKNALHFVNPDLKIALPYAALGGVLVVDSDPHYQMFFDLLPNSDEAFLQDPTNVLLDKDAFLSYVRTEDTPDQVISHLFSAVAEVESKKKSSAYLQKIEDLSQRLEMHIRQKLSVSLSDELGKVLQQMSAEEDRDLTLAELAQRLDRERAPIDKQWLKHVHELQVELQALQDCYAQVVSGKGRASHGMISQNAAGTYPWSPVVVPWAQNGPGEGVELALGIWEAHMAKLCPEFVALRKTELELKGRYNPRIHDAFFHDFSWKQLSAEELALCPPLVITGSDTDFYQSQGTLNELFRSGAPIKVLVFDSMHSNPMSPLQQLIANDIFVMQSSLCDLSHLLTGFAQGFLSSKPALLQVLSPLHVEDAQHFARRVFEGGVYALYHGLNRHGSPEIVLHPETYTELAFKDEQTFADLVSQDRSFDAYFAESSPLAGTKVGEYWEMDEEDRLETVPVVENSDGSYRRVLPALLDRIDEVQRVKTVLRQFARLDEASLTADDFMQEARSEVVKTVAQSLLALAREKV